MAQHDSSGTPHAEDALTQGYGPGRGPAAVSLSEDALAKLLGEQRFGVLATSKRDGTPHLATMLYTWDPAERLIRISSAEDRIKVRHLRREPTAALHATGPDPFSYVVAEGKAEVSPASDTPGDATGRELLAMVPPFTDPAEEAAFLENMVADRRVVIRLHVSHMYGITFNS